MRLGRSVNATRQVIPCWRASGANAASNSSRPRPKPWPSITILMKKCRPAVAHMLVGAEDIPLCSAMKLETAAIRPR